MNNCGNVVIAQDVQWRAYPDFPDAVGQSLRRAYPDFPDAVDQNQQGMANNATICIIVESIHFMVMYGTKTIAESVKNAALRSRFAVIITKS